VQSVLELDQEEGLGFEEQLRMDEVQMLHAIDGERADKKKGCF